MTPSLADLNRAAPAVAAGTSCPSRSGELRKALTGIRGLDEVTRGGLPEGRPTLICGGPGSGKTLLALTFLVNGAVRFDEPGVLMTFEENEEEMASDIASFGLYVLKSPGMAHSNEMCEFVLTSHGLTLANDPHGVHDSAPAE